MVELFVFTLFASFGAFFDIAAYFDIKAGSNSYSEGGREATYCTVYSIGYYMEILVRKITTAYSRSKQNYIKKGKRSEQLAAYCLLYISKSLILILLY
jgi:hypothetical protein